MTISDPSFPTPKFHQKALSTSDKNKTQNISPPKKFTPAALLANLVDQLLNGNKKTQTKNGKSVDNNVEAEITAKTVGQTEFVPYREDLKYPENNENLSESSSWWQPLLAVLLRASHFDLEELAESSWLGKALMVVKVRIFFILKLIIRLIYF